MANCAAPFWSPKVKRLTGLATVVGRTHISITQASSGTEMTSFIQSPPSPPKLSDAVLPGACVLVTTVRVPKPYSNGLEPAESVGRTLSSSPTCQKCCTVGPGAGPERTVKTAAALVLEPPVLVMVTL